MSRFLALAFVVLVLASIGQTAWQHTHLPEFVASHFDANGQADGWMSRTAQTVWHLGTVLFLATLFEGLARLNSRLPDDYINIPHRDYWLARTRRDATHAWLRDMVRLLGCLLLLFFLGLFHQVYRANLAGRPQLGASTGFFIAGFLVCAAVVTGAVFFRFNRKPA